MPRTLSFTSPPAPKKYPPPSPRPPPPPNDHPYIALTHLLINISCLPANFDRSFFLLNSMLATNSVQKFIFNEPDTYITDYRRPVSDIENLYSCLLNSSLTIGNLSVTENNHLEDYSPVMQTSKYYDNTSISFSILVNETYILQSNIITIYHSGDGLSIGISFVFTVFSVCICSCLCFIVCKSCARVHPR